MDACRSCGAPIVWAITCNGSRMPIDRDPTPDGNVMLAEGGGDVSCAVLAGAILEGARARAADLHKSHFATCPEADRWREKAAG